MRRRVGFRLSSTHSLSFCASIKAHSLLCQATGDSCALSPERCALALVPRTLAASSRSPLPNMGKSSLSTDLSRETRLRDASACQVLTLSPSAPALKLTRCCVKLRA
jgi:hypothetical protein